MSEKGWRRRRKRKRVREKDTRTAYRGYKPKDYGNLPSFVPHEMFSYYAFYLCKKGCEPLQLVTVGTFCVVSG